MSELQSGGSEGLNPEQRAAFTEHLGVMLDPGSIAAGTAEEVQAIKAGALEDLAKGLADEEIGQAVSDLIIEEHESSERPASITDLYVHWLIIKTALEQHPDAELPGRFLSFTQELAQNHGESDIAFKLVVLSSRIDDIKIDHSSSLLDSTVAEQASSSIQDLDSLREKTDATLSFLSSQASEELDRLSGDEQYMRDRALLEDTASDPSELLRAIRNNSFVTDEGLRASRLQHDSDRLDVCTGDPSELLRAVQNNWFLTDEGLEAAKAQQDSDRLDASVGDPSELLRAIQNNWFLTSAGRMAAIVQQDNDRLEANIGDHSELLRAVQNNWFLTDEGLEAAKTQQDSDRLDAHASDIGSLRNDLMNNRFLTPDGIAEARRILGLS